MNLYLATVKKQLHVLFLSSWFPSKTHHTLGNFVQRHAEAVALFAQVTVLYLSKNNRVDTITIEDSTEENVRIVRVYYPSNGILFFKRIQALNQLLSLKKSTCNAIPFEEWENNPFVIYENLLENKKDENKEKENEKVEKDENKEKENEKVEKEFN